MMSPLTDVSPHEDYPIYTHHLPYVSVVIPTRNRPNLVLRAVRSALTQTYPNVEVVVVVDGADPMTGAALGAIQDPRLKLVQLENSVGGSEARNFGVRNASGDWIALLDDDDEWMPRKLELQMNIALDAGLPEPIVSCRYIHRSPQRDRICPAKIPGNLERIDEFTCCPTGYSQGEGFLQTSTLVATRELFLHVPFPVGLRRGQDFAWLMSACLLGKRRVLVQPEVLSIFYADGSGTAGISRDPAWRSLYDWFHNNGSMFSPKAYSFCLATILLPDVMKCREPLHVRFLILADMLRNGQWHPKAMLLFVIRAFIPMRLVTALRFFSQSIRRKPSRA